MLFDTENQIVKLCASGMELEGAGEKAQALNTFREAWGKSTNDFEKFISAHYIARHQETIPQKLHWDETALQCALNVPGEEMKSNLPSLYLNIAKCYEDMGDPVAAETNYRMAENYTGYLKDDGYGQMVRSGILAGLGRVRRGSGGNVLK